jgi:hypothetical protein
MRRLALLLLALAAALPARAAEEITRFAAAITVNPDSTITVTETITVTVEHREIRRGVIRELPLSRTAPDGARWRTPYDVLSVTQDGRPATWRVEREGDRLAIRIGDPNVVLPRRPHTYAITYRSGAQVRPFPDHDELWWNVTGEGWVFPILRAEAVVTLPAGATADRVIAWTGPRGTSEQGAEITRLGPGQVAFASRRVLRPGEGLTVAVAFPKGFVAHPPPPLIERIGRLPPTLAALCLVVGLAVLAWRRVGREPAARAIMPRFSPPEGVSAPACRYVRRMGYDSETLAAGLLALAAKERVALRRGEDGVWTVSARRPADEAFSLDAAESALLAALPTSPTRMERTTSTVAGPLHRADAALKAALARAHGGRAFHANRLVFGFLALVALALGAALLLLATPDRPITGPLVALGARLLAAGGAIEDARALIWAGLGGIALAVLGGPVAAVLPKRLRLLRRLLGAVPFIVMAAVFLPVVILASLVLLGEYGPLWWLYVLGAAATLAWAWLALPARTPAGQRLFEEIEGFRMFLSLTEQDRLAALHPPELTPELFHRFLPFALALDVVSEWTTRFAAAVAAGAIPAEAAQRGYTSAWGDIRNPARFGRELGAITRSLESAVVSAAAPAAPSGRDSGFGGGGGGEGAGEAGEAAAGSGSILGRDRHRGDMGASSQVHAAALG